MKPIKSIQGVVLLAVAVSAATANAADLNINGKVVSSPCIVDTASVSRDVDFGQLIIKKDLATAGAGGDWKSFEVRLNNCPATVSSVIANFTGTPAQEDATLYSNSGTATHVGVQLVTDADKTVVLAPGSQLSADVDAQRSAVYELAARPYTTSGEVTAGSLVSLTQINFTYQ
ncbi:fimbrial protein [Rahnella sp. PD12R]|uniref:fimbrial protein n=1 Tax=Rahnella sp. PD12R TaxID=2855688 RepID=UPI001C46B135|nr:fimbrial protein [Rahnella sp. PD12R]MBV6819489.1 fimbrial protein [Rahnella sp. PD12R]